MELSPTTIEHLRDEAYAMLCRHAVMEALEKIEREKASIASTRPPFGILASRQARDTFERSLHAATGTESALRTRLGQLIQLETWLHDILHTELREYLAIISPDYRRFATADALLDQWEIEFRTLPELLVAFARDVRNVQQDAASAPGHRDLQPFAVLRDSALRVEQQLTVLDNIAAQIAFLLPAAAAAEVRVPALPDFRRVAWVNRIASLPPEQLVAETSRVERDARAFAAHDHSTVPLRLQASHEACRHHEDIFVKQYWDQLRAHAQAHYVEDREIDEVIEILTQNYVTSDLARRQKEIAAFDPFLGER
jgi:hypothetical protein